MASELKVNTLTGVSTAGSIAVTAEGNSTTTNLQQGLAKSWINYKQAATFVTNDSFNISSVNDDGTGEGDTNYTNNFGNANYATAGAAGRVNLTGTEAYWTFPTRGSNSVYSTSSTSWTSGFNGGSSDALTAADCVLNIISTYGDLA
tara:strand:+ start:630 stop:1070 length:441 start_codon:yes stop_codon:yes gene_type:complete